MKILVTGFDPFGNDTLNPSFEAVRRLPETIDGKTLILKELPTVRDRSLAKIRNLIELYHPDIILSTGVAAGRKGITVERAALNIDDFTIADNDGNCPVDEKIFADGPDAYFSTLPVKKMAAAITAAGFEASVSNTAGTFVCNHVFYGTRYLCAHEWPQIRSGFIHVPWCSDQNKEGIPVMDLDDITAALAAAIAVI